MLCSNAFRMISPVWRTFPVVYRSRYAGHLIARSNPGPCTEKVRYGNQFDTLRPTTDGATSPLTTCSSSCRGVFQNWSVNPEGGSQLRQMESVDRVVRRVAVFHWRFSTMALRGIGLSANSDAENCKLRRRGGELRLWMDNGIPMANTRRMSWTALWPILMRTIQRLSPIDWHILQILAKWIRRPIGPGQVATSAQTVVRESLT